MQILSQPMSATELANIITAIGALGTAAFGLVEASKAFWGGVNRIGFPGPHPKNGFLPDAGRGSAQCFIAAEDIGYSGAANWYNGTDLASQKAIAKTLINLNLSVDNAPALAMVTGVDAAALTAIANNIANGTALTAAQSDVFGRFDLILTALLDETYQRSDQFYRNWTRSARCSHP